jgi:cell division protein ZapA
MSHVNVTINGRQYRMACEDGEEDHLVQLAQDLDRRIGDLRGSFGEIGDMRLTVMAAIMVADELSESQRRLQRTDQEVAAAQDLRRTATDRSRQTQAAVIAALNAASERIEQVTKGLNQSLTEGVPIG